ncbi:MAG: SH3 domain-containing protein [Bacteroidetes bacterium]|nr:SH3 domain-containing protein [Bacteroidota bacterium]
MKKLVLLFIIVFLGNILNAQTLDIIGNGNLRSGPGTNNGIIGKVTIGMKVKQLGFSNDWYKIEITDKLSGWINKSLVKVEKQDTREQKYLQTTIDDYIILITFMQYKFSSCPFSYDEKMSKYAQDTLFSTIKKYGMGVPKDEYVLPHGVLSGQKENIISFSSYPDKTWFDVMDALFESRGNFPKIEIKNADYDINFLHNGKILQDTKKEDVNEIKVVYNDGMEIQLNNIEWIYKNNGWVKK